MRTSDGSALAPDARRVGFGRLAAAASALSLLSVACTHTPTDRLRVCGTPRWRIDPRYIVTGRAPYAGHLRIPSAVRTVVALPTTINGTLASLDASAARAMPGVLGVVRIPSGVA
ncbi:hypothetical protein VM98_33575, partial [Streptomyces rubellomurinus subsp. indigoferus]